MTAAPREPTRIDFDVSWAGDGTYAGEHDRLHDPAAPRLLTGTYHCRIGRDVGRPYGKQQIPTAGGEFRNDDRLLSGEFVGSDLYQLVEPGKPARVRMSAGAEIDYDDPDLDYDDEAWYDGVETFSRVVGVLDEPQQRPALAEKSVGLSLQGSLSKLRGNRKSTPLHRLIRLDLWIHALLDVGGWPADKRRIAIADTTLEWAWADADEGDLLDHVEDACGTEGLPSYYGEARDGYFVFQNRNWRSQQATSTTVQATLYDRLATDVDYDADVDYDDPATYYDVGAQLWHQGVGDYSAGRTEIVNRAVCVVRQRVAQPLQKVREYGTSLVLGAGETRDVELTFDDPVTGLLAPEDGTDYTVASGSLAGVPTLVASYARRATIRWVAGAGGATVNGVTSNGFQVRAEPAAVVGEETVANSIDASASIARLGGDPIGVRERRIDALAEINRSTAIALCDAMVAYSMAPRPMATVTLMNIDWEHLAFQLAADISWRIAVVQEQLGLFGDFWIEQIDERREPAKLVTELTCSRVLQEPGAGLWDDMLWNVGLWAR